MFNCTYCNKAYTAKSSLNVHMMSHSGKKLYACMFCDKRFSRNNYLPVHMRVHTGERPYKCSVCGKTFRQNANLRKHEKLHLPGHFSVHAGEWPYRCSLCQKTFRNLGSLTRHKKLHDEIKCLICSICYKQFSEKSLFENHFQQHSCSKSKGYRQIGSGCTREKVHSGQQQYHCVNCGKNFSQKQDFEKHCRTHLAVPAYICQLCGKGFTRLKILHNHAQKIHCNQISFGCGFCHRKFTDTGTFTNHMKYYFVHGYCEDDDITVNSDNGKEQDVEQVMIPKANVFRVEDDLIIIVISEHDVNEGEMCHAWKHVKGKLGLLTAKKISSNGKSFISNDNEASGLLTEKQSRIVGNIPNLKRKISGPFCKKTRKKFSKLHSGNGKNKLGCDVCDAKLTKKKHGKRKRKYCKLCGKFFISTKRFEMHMKNHEDYKQLKNSSGKNNCIDGKFHDNHRSLCLTLNEACTENKSENHCSEFSDNQQQACRFCETKHSVGNFSTHGCQQGEKEDHKCNVCHELFVTKSDLLMHMMKVHKQEFPYTCHICCKSLSTEDSFINHSNMHPKEELHTCSNCGKNLKEVHGVNEQLNNHGTLQSAQCSDCHMKLRDVKYDKCHLAFHEMQTEGYLQTGKSPKSSSHKVSSSSSIDHDHFTIILESDEQDSSNSPKELNDFGESSKSLLTLTNSIINNKLDDFLPSLVQCVEIEVTEMMG